MAEATSASSPEWTAQAPSAPLFQKLKWHMLFRLLLAAGMVGTAAVVQLRGYRPQSSLSVLYTIAATTFLLSATYAMALRHIRRLSVLAYVQFLLDALLVTPVVYVTGGIESVFGFLYFWIIISAAHLLYTSGAFYAATISGLFYAAMVFAQAKRILPNYQDSPSPADDLSYAFYNITINVFAFFLVAFLSSYLAEQLKDTRAALLEEQHNLRELEELNSKIVENINAGIMTLDHNGRITFLNRAAREIIGAELNELSGNNVDDIFPATLASLEDILLPEGSTLRPTRWERHFSRRDKQRLYLGFSTSPLKNPDGMTVGKILIFEDLTRMKRLEEKTRRDDRLKTIGRLAAGLAHELRNPLASLSGSIQVLRDELELQDENRDLMDIVVRETDRLNGLLTDFLHYTRPAQRENQPVRIERLIQEVLEALRHSPQCSPRILFETRTDHHTQPHGDEAQLRQVLWNLALNAVEVMKDGGVLTISTRELPGQAGEPPRLEIQVADTGPGIPAAILEQLFDPFFSTKPGGTGLGLALVEKLVQVHDGSVRARTLKEGGAAFEILLPLRSPTQSSPDADTRSESHVG